MHICTKYKKIHLCKILQEVITVTHLLAHCSQLVS